MVKTLLASMFLAGVTLACDDESPSTAPSSVPAPPPPAAEPTATPPAATAKADTGTAAFTINGTAATTTPTENDKTVHSANFQSKSNVLNVYLEGFTPPDTRRHQLAIQIKNFTGGPGTFDATANIARRNAQGKEFVYGTKGESFKITITKIAFTSSVMNMRTGALSGTFEGGTLAWSVPTQDGTELTRDQVITNGSFDDIKLTELSF